MDVVRRRHLITRKGRELVGLDDEVFDQDAVDDGRSAGRRRGRAARRARAQPHRPHGRHRRHDPGRAGRGDPRRHRRRRSSSPAARARARPRSRCTAPRTSSTRTAAGSRAQGVLLIGPEPGVPALHRARAAVARRAGRAALDDLGAAAAAARRAAPSPTPRPRSRATPAWRRSSSARSPTASGRLRNDFTLLIDGLQLRVRRARRRSRIVEGAHRRRGTHNEKRPYVARRFVDLLVAQLQERGGPRVPARGADDAARRQRHEPLRPRQHARRRRRGRARARRSTARGLGAGAACAVPRAGPR